MVRAAETARAAGAVSVHALAMHGLFTGNASEAIVNPASDSVMVSDTVPPFRLTGEARSRVENISAAPAVAEAIRRLHDGAPLSDLISPVE